MKRRDIAVVIGGVQYAIGGNTPDNFTVIEPRSALLNINSLFEKLRAIEKTTRRPLVDPNHRELRGLCSECVPFGDKVAVKLVAQKVADGNSSYKIICTCRDEEKVYVIADSFIEELALPRRSAKNGLQPQKDPTMRMQAFAGAAA